jgi:hypothetical protein
MDSISRLLDQFVDMYTKTDKKTISLIEKDILLRQLQDLYVAVNSLRVTSEKAKIVVAETPKIVVEEPKISIDKPVNETQTVIGEVLGKDKISLYDKLSDGSKQDVSSKLSEKTISDIKAAIPIGERFLYQRELFNDDFQQFNNAIEILNNFTEFNQAINFLLSELKIDENNAHLQAFLDVVRRRYL